MLTAYSLAELEPMLQDGRPSVVTIGNFDGVHVGHQAVIAAVRARAQACDARSVVVTFDPHPSHVLPQGRRTPLITTLPRKLSLLAATGVDLTLVLPFNDALSGLSARAFAEEILCRSLRTMEVHEGETFRFGHRAEADIAGLATLGREFHFTVQAYRPVIRRGAAVSSSRIRNLVAAGQLSTARALLGRSFSVDSTPAHGRGFGTRYAVPTINLALKKDAVMNGAPSLLPANGVYVTRLDIGAGNSLRAFHGVTNAGDRPTFGEDSYAIETHLFDFSPLELSPETPLCLTFLLRLRDERRFANPDALKAQIGLDVRRSQRFLALCSRLRTRSSRHNHSV